MWRRNYLLVYKISEKGSRELNEDRFYVETRGKKKIYLVADGCGGHSSGEIASRLICDSLPELLFECDDTADSIKNGINLCNVKVLEQQKTYKGMRSTVVGLYKSKDKYFAFNVGDSRLYQIRNGNIIFNTEDHSVPYLLYKADIIAEDEINTHEDRNKLLEALGNKDKIKINVYQLDVKQGDVFVLATDGFWEHFYRHDFTECLVDNCEDWLSNRIDYIKKTNDPEQDNYTAVVIGESDE